MGAGIVGADVDALRGLGREFTKASDQLEALRTAIDGSVRSSAWHGPDAEDFRGGWNRSHVARIIAARDALRAAASTLTRNAEAQRTTSDELTGGSDAGGFAGGGGGGGGGGGIAGLTWEGSGTATDSLYRPERESSAFVGPELRATDSRVNSMWVGLGGLVATGGGLGAEATGGSAADDSSGRYLAKNHPNTFTREDPRKALDHSVKLAGGHVGGVQGLQGGVDGRFGTEDGAHGAGQVNGWVGAKEDLGANAAVGKDGAKAEAYGSVGVGAGAAASGAIGYGIAQAKGSADGFVGARLQGNAGASVGPDGVSANAGFDAMAGAEGSVSGSAGVDGAQVGAKASGYIGVGASADASFNLGAEGLKGHVELGAALGIGGKLSFDVDIEPKKLVENAEKLWPF